MELLLLLKLVQGLDKSIELIIQLLTGFELHYLAHDLVGELHVYHLAKALVDVSRNFPKDFRLLSFLSFLEYFNYLGVHRINIVNH